MSIAGWVGMPELIDWILAGMCLELLALAILGSTRRRGASTLSWTVSLAAGAALLLALRATLSHAAPWAIEGWLLAALAAHVADVKMRWSTPAGGSLIR